MERIKSTRAANPDFFRIFCGMLIKTETPFELYYCRKGLF
jgi:hypothetical protein